MSFACAEFDHREALVELAEALAGRLRLGFEPRAEPRPDRIEPVSHQAGEIGLAGAELLRHAGDTAVQLGARLRQPGEARLDRFLPLERRLRLALARRAEAHQRDQRQEQQASERGQRGGERLVKKDRQAVDDGDGRGRVDRHRVGPLRKGRIEQK